jgi:hypothetical protein
MSKGNGSGHGNGELVQVGGMLPAHVAAANPLDLPAEHFRAGLDRRKANRAALMEWIRDALIEGTDYGRIHVVGRNRCRLGSRCENSAHFSKPSLFKPGAEKICGMLGVTVHFPTLDDYEQAALHGVELAQIIMRCEIHDAAGRVVADGVGARALKQDFGDVNKALKMAEKSAHIDATLRMAGLSEVFTQDLEDMRPDEPTQAGKSASPSHPTSNADEPTRTAPPGRRNGATISKAQQRRLEARIDALGLDRQRVRDWLRRATANRRGGAITDFADLPVQLLDRLEAKLEAMAEREAIQSEADG